jgi:hypothetical protein
MAKKQVVADVLVNRQWWSTAINLVSSQVEPKAANEYVRVRGPLVSEDHQGIWLSDVPSTLVHAKEPSRKVMMRFLIPWSQIVAIGIIDDAGMKVGFGAETVSKEA